MYLAIHTAAVGKRCIQTLQQQHPPHKNPRGILFSSTCSIAKKITYYCITTVAALSTISRIATTTTTTTAYYIRPTPSLYRPVWVRRIIATNLWNPFTITTTTTRRQSSMSTTIIRDNDGTIALTPKQETDQSALVVICHGLGDSAEGFVDVAEVRTRERHLHHLKYHRFMFFCCCLGPFSYLLCFTFL